MGSLVILKKKHMVWLLALVGHGNGCLQAGKFREERCCLSKVLEHPFLTVSQEI